MLMSNLGVSNAVYKIACAGLSLRYSVCVAGTLCKQPNSIPKSVVSIVESATDLH